jgi:beta-galactosidase
MSTPQLVRIKKGSSQPELSDRSTDLGAITIPDIELDGRQSKIIVTDYKVGKSSSLLYSSAEVLTYATLDVDVIVFYLNIGQKGVFVFKDAPEHLTFQAYGKSNVTSSTSTHGAQYSYTQGEGTTVLKFSNGVLVYLLDKETAWKFFAAPTTSDPHVSPSEQILARSLFGSICVHQPGYRQSRR